MNLKGEKTRRASTMGQATYAGTATLLGVTAVAILFGVSAQTIRVWADRGRLTAIRDSAGRRLFYRSDVEELRRRMEAGSK
jgi:excisionase family DNA binding protein